MNLHQYKLQMERVQNEPDGLWKSKAETMKRIDQLDHEIEKLRKYADPKVNAREKYLMVLKEIDIKIATEEAAHKAAEDIRCAWNS